MKKYSIIYIDFEHPSFTWGNGHYIIVGDRDKGTTIDICRIGDNGMPEMFNGEFSVSCTGKNNSGIKKTKGYIVIGENIVLSKVVR